MIIPITDSVPRRNFPTCVTILITINAAVFLLEISLPSEQLTSLFLRFALIPARYTSPQWAAAYGLDAGNYFPFFSSLFIHVGWFHILTNMWMLWLFGRSVEDRLGSVNFAILYVVCGFVAGGAHAVLHPGSQLPVLGASGAIAGVLGAYTLMFFRARIIVLVLVIFLPLFFAIPAFVFTLLWFGIQLLQGIAELSQPIYSGGIAWWAHIGGFLAGLGLAFARRFLPPRYRPHFRDETVHGFGPRGES